MSSQVFGVPREGNYEERRRGLSFSAGTFALVAIAAVVLVFVLPLFIPFSPVRGISAAWLAGFNNSVAVLGAAALSVAVLLYTMWRERGRSLPALPAAVSQRLGPLYVGGVVLGSSAVLVLASVLVMVARQRYLGDAGYFIEQASAWNETGRRLYSQLEFAYGPLLLMPEAWAARVLHVSVTAAYFGVFVVESAMGLLMLAYVLNALPMRVALRRWGLVLFAIAALTPHLGLNYTYFRFASPLAVFLLVTRVARGPWMTALGMALGLALVLAISPELAFAMAAGVLVYAGLRAWQGGAAWIVAGVVPLLVLGGLLATVGRAYLAMVATFASGVYNLPVGPYPHVLMFLLALVWLVPVGLARMVDIREPGSAVLLSVYAIALAMLSAALRRCDPLHVLFNGLPFFVLSLMVLSWASVRARVAWIACLAFVVLWEHRVNEAFFSYRTARTVQRAVLPYVPASLRGPVVWAVALPNRDVVKTLRQAPEPPEVLDTAALDGVVSGAAAVATPLEVSPEVEDALKRSHHYSPMYHAFGVDMGDQRSEEGCVQELRAYRWMLLPTERKLSGYQLYPEKTGSLQGMRMYFRQRRPVLFVPGAALETAVAQEWMPVRSFGPYTLYERR